MIIRKVGLDGRGLSLILARTSGGSTRFVIQFHDALIATTRKLDWSFGMSRAAKLTLAGTSVMAVGIIVFVHYAQQSEKAVG